MGFEAFKELWRRRAEFDISILVLPVERRAGKFRRYETAAGMSETSGAGASGAVATERDGLRIVWGDATDPEATAATIKGADAVLNAMAYISPQADYRPEIARAVNHDAVALILAAIAAEPDGRDRIRYLHTGSVAQTGNRPVGMHMGRVGDPMKPSVFDYYALTKIAGERLVLESDLRLWASLRMTFIMPTDFRALFDLLDPISFHMPLDARMENITARDAGHGLVNALDLPAESDFWRRAYNMGGGPAMRTTAYQYMVDNYQNLGVRWEACAERNWYALRNFHMQYYEDSGVTNDYLNYQRDTLETHQRAIADSMPLHMRLLGFLAGRLPAVRRLAEGRAHAMLADLAQGHRNSPLHWYQQRNEARITAFFGGFEEFEAITGWGVAMPDLRPDAPWRRLDHGYDETKPLLALSDLTETAAFRGGRCLEDEWDGDAYARLNWVCARGHEFTARPYTVLGAGHWCPVCVESWDGSERARADEHFAQVWYADHDPEESYHYPVEGGQDIRDADLDWAADVFAPAIEEPDRLIVASTSLLEVFKWVLREHGESQALTASTVMQQGKVIDLDASLALRAAKLGSEFRLPLADSVILATARAHEAILWTQDADFEGIPGVQYRPTLK